ncbi:hypothetical protein EYF80_050037 [Liparis tanakae]|uniref:Uncharacterized protein n=1 Tax=Liparis tanakae TaxID=230148 RepID=A0A4Z2FHK0_9TELE|nr:hypothetical protein EYF80_050037 [Liparis tanakae]
MAEDISGSYCLFVFSFGLCSPLKSCPVTSTRQMINVMLLHQRIIKCSAVTAGTPWQKVNGVGGEGGRGGVVDRLVEKARWEGSMAHLTPTCLLLNQATPLHTTHTLPPPGNEVVQLLGNECAQSDAATCGDSLKYYTEGSLKKTCAT